MSKRELNTEAQRHREIKITHTKDSIVSVFNYSLTTLP